VDSEPELIARLGDGPEHLTKCHFPVADGEDISMAKPTISAENRVVETGILGDGEVVLPEALTAEADTKEEA
jgi:hypothetical protein